MNITEEQECCHTSLTVNRLLAFAKKIAGMLPKQAKQPEINPLDFYWIFQDFKRTFF